MALSPKQQAFVDHYCVTWNGAEAARLAGYSEHTAREQASRLLTNVNVQEAIEAYIAAIIPKGEVIQRLADHARGSADDFLTIERVKRRDTITQTVINDAGEEETQFVPGPEYEVVETRLDFEKVKERGKLHLIKKISETKYGLQVEVYDAQSALALLGKHHKLFTEKVEHSGTIDVSTLSDDELRAIATAKSTG